MSTRDVVRASCPRARAERSRRHGPDARATLGMTAPMNTMRLPSRLLVTVESWPCDSRALTSFSQNAATLAPFRRRFVPICAQNAHQFAPFKKVMSFVFKYFLASFPLFLYFLALLVTSQATSDHAAFPRSRLQPGRVRRQKARILRLKRALGTQFEFVLSSFSKLPSCVFNNILASFVLFFVFSGPRFSRVPGLLQLFLALRSLPTTMCPQNDHNYRLAYIPGFVKRKMLSGTI